MCCFLQFYKKNFLYNELWLLKFKGVNDTTYYFFELREFIFKGCTSITGLKILCGTGDSNRKNHIHFQKS